MKQIKNIYQKYYKSITQICFPFLLFVYPFWNVNHGVDVSDSTYSLTNFLFFESMDGTWAVSTYVANVVGWMLTKLPFGTTLLGMNIYTTLLLSATVLLVYFKLRKWMPAWIVFVGEIVAIGFCWIPTGILYNYLSYFFFVLGAICLYQGLVEEKDGCLLAAGASLGANVFVRIPNLTQMALILGLWFYLWKKKQNMIIIMRKTSVCFVGYLAGIMVPLFFIVVQYGWNGIMDMVVGLSSIQSTDETYSIFGMISMTLDAYIRTFKWGMLIVFYILMGMAAFFCTRKIHVKSSVFRNFLCGFYILGIGVLLRFLWGRGMFSFRYYEDYSAMYEWGMIGLYLIWIMGIYMIFSKKSSLEEKLFAIMSMIIVAVTPLGSNNYTFQNLNNLFLVAPFGLYALVKAYRRKIKKELWRKLELPWKSVIAVVGFMILIQSIGFHSQFVFRDGMDGSTRIYEFEEPSVVAGMKTTESNGGELTALMEFVKKRGWNGKKAVFFGDCPGLGFLLRMPVAIGSAWPDLDSYGYTTFCEDIDKMEDRPVVIVRKQEMTGELVDSKKEYLKDFMKKNNYKDVYGSDNYTIYAPGNGN